ncbi:MAG: type II toxin-antitoxin system VapC family toxin [Thalassotalea sp.]|nr:type II toxin-antitoxin system VapC family toxin [Thalassotalea sp.]MDG2393621.1 type II toxin-antitoxin system VapC family toxin [Thalassotalea sp.]
MFLLDTNVISELRKASTNKAEKNVVEWATQQSVGSMFISAISILEIEMGILQKERKDPAQAALLRTWLNSHVLKAFSDRILPLDTSVAIQCAKLHVPNPKSERDAMIGATAKVHGMTLITRNIKDFRHMDLDIFNPWITS